jgi:hypothetical protein
MLDYMLSMFEPSTVLGTLTWGIIGGVLTSALLFLASALVLKVWVPWYQAVSYQGVDLSGTWAAEKGDAGTRFDYILNLEQKAHRLIGSLTIKKTIPAGAVGEGYVQGFEVTGSTWEGFVTLTMKSSNRRSLSFAASLLQIQDRGETMGGQLVYRSIAQGAVQAEGIAFRRQGA